ncbi:MAG: VCBS repeat-containing protein [Thermodesulfobacteriota bacterium]|nr:VCBS repeat-containing protein [Thermodesulfobacteriota bacterium]
MTKKKNHRPDRAVNSGYLVKGAAAISVTSLVAMMSPAHDALAADNPFVQQFGKGNNPLHAPVGVDYRNQPALVDINNDGLVDIFIGGRNGDIAYFENTGTADAAVFTKQVGEDNPFNDGYIPNAAPAFADINDDDLPDAAIGGGDGYIHYFVNTGTADAPAFTEMTGEDNPFGDGYDGYIPAGYTTPMFADLNGDDLVDALVGDYYGNIHYFENTGTADAPAFTRGGATAYSDAEGYLADAEGYRIDVGNYADPSHMDLNNDGIVDPGEAIVVGDQNGYLEFLQKEEDGTFTRYDDSSLDNPFYGIDVGSYAAPAFADLDDDGDLDAAVGERYEVDYFENLTGNDDPVFAERSGTESPFSGFDVGDLSQPVFVDIDGDGDMDAFNSPKYGNGIITFFENTGTADVPEFVEREGVNNPLDDVPQNYDNSFLAFADIDGDGDMDLFVGKTTYKETFTKYSATFEISNVGSVDFYENTGTATAPSFEKQPDAENPLFFMEDPHSDFTFVDIDGDGDLDAFGAGYSYAEGYSLIEREDFYSIDGHINFYENKGDKENPAFAPGSDDLLGYVFDQVDSTYSVCYSLAFGDIDGDGDLDVTVGVYEFGEFDDGGANLQLHENVGDETSPAFVPVAEANNTFAKLNEQSDYGILSPAFIDIDGDGDLDVFMGEAAGRFLFFENTTDPSDGGAAVAVAGDDSGGGGCFIDTARNDTEKGNWFVRTARRAYSAITGSLR